MLRSKVLSPGPSPLGRAVQDCGDVVRAVWLARQAIVSEGQKGRSGRMPEEAGFRAAGISGA